MSLGPYCIYRKRENETEVRVFNAYVWTREASKQREARNLFPVRFFISIFWYSLIVVFLHYHVNRERKLIVCWIDLIIFQGISEYMGNFGCNRVHFPIDSCFYAYQEKNTFHRIYKKRRKMVKNIDQVKESSHEK